MNPQADVPVQTLLNAKYGRECYWRNREKKLQMKKDAYDRKREEDIANGVPRPGRGRPRIRDDPPPKIKKLQDDPSPKIKLKLFSSVILNEHP